MLDFVWGFILGWGLGDLTQRAARAAWSAWVWVRELETRR